MSFTTCVMENATGQKRADGRPAITTTMTFVTPENASAWIAKNNDGNRRVRRDDVAMFKGQIVEGTYEATHQGIGFYADGSLADGQHRLIAIAEAGIGIWINVTTGLKRSAVHKIDRGIGRTALDSLHFLGMKSDNKRVAVCQGMIYQFRSERAGRERWEIEKTTSQDFAAFYAAFAEAIEFTMNFGTASKYPAPLKSAVATAWFSENRQRLGEFMMVLDCGEMFSDDDRAAIRLRDYLKDKKYGNGGTARNDLFLRCCGAVRYFIARRNLTKLYATPDHAFKFAGYAGEVG